MTLAEMLNHVSKGETKFLLRFEDFLKNECEEQFCSISIEVAKRSAEKVAKMYSVKIVEVLEI